MEVNSVTKKEREQEWMGKKDLLCREEKEPYKSYLIRNSDGVSPMRKNLHCYLNLWIIVSWKITLIDDCVSK